MLPKDFIVQGQDLVDQMIHGLGWRIVGAFGGTESKLRVKHVLIIFNIIYIYIFGTYLACPFPRLPTFARMPTYSSWLA